MPDDVAVEGTRQRLEEELAALRTRRDALAADLDERDTVGDGADRADVLERADDIARMDDRIAAISQLLVRGIPAEPIAGGLPHGTLMTLRFDDGDVATMRAVTLPEEYADNEDMSALTIDSPLGQALAGTQAGDIVSYETPAGVAYVEVLDVKPASR